MTTSPAPAAPAAVPGGEVVEGCVTYGGRSGLVGVECAAYVRRVSRVSSSCSHSKWVQLIMRLFRHSSPYPASGPCWPMSIRLAPALQTTSDHLSGNNMICWSLYFIYTQYIYDRNLRRYRTPVVGYGDETADDARSVWLVMSGALIVAAVSYSLHCNRVYRFFLLLVGAIHLFQVRVDMYGGEMPVVWCTACSSWISTRAEFAQWV